MLEYLSLCYLGDNSILQRATDAKTRTDEAQIKERIQLAYHSALTKDITGENGELKKSTLQEELNNEFKDKTVTITDSEDKTQWIIMVDNVDVAVVAGKDGSNNEEEIDLSVDTTWQKVLDGSYNQYGPTGYSHWVLDEENKTLTLRSGPPITVENVEIKSYAVINGVKYDTKLPDSCSALFSGNTSLKLITIDPKIDMSNITDMSSMFAGCNSLTSVNTSDWNTSNVTNMKNMFENCNSLVSLDLSSWDTSNVTNMQGMFAVANSSHLQTIIVSDKFVTTNVSTSNMSGIFAGSYSTLVGGNGTTGKYFSDNHNYDEKLAASIDTAVYDESGNLVSGTPGFFTAK